MEVKSIFKSIFKFLIILALLLILISGYLIIFHGYRDTESNYSDRVASIYEVDADGDGVPNKEDIVKNARALKGVFYEYLKGKYNNLGGRLGFLVCIDVPRIAYAKAGIDFEPLLKKDFTINKSYYDVEGGSNTPESPFFSRRVRNYYAFFEANNQLIKQCKQPQVGDLVFYGRYHVALVSGVHEDGTYNEIETAPWTGFVVEHKNKNWVPIDVGRML